MQNRGTVPRKKRLAHVLGTGCLVLGMLFLVSEDGNAQQKASQDTSQKAPQDAPLPGWIKPAPKRPGGCASPVIMNLGGTQLRGCRTDNADGATSKSADSTKQQADTTKPQDSTSRADSASKSASQPKGAPKP